MKQRLQQIYAEWQLPVFMVTILTLFMTVCYYFAFAQPSMKKDTHIKSVSSALFTYSYMNNIHEIFFEDVNQHNIEAFNRKLNNTIKEENESADEYSDFRYSSESVGDYKTPVTTLVSNPAKICTDDD